MKRLWMAAVGRAAVLWGSPHSSGVLIASVCPPPRMNWLYWFNSRKSLLAALSPLCWYIPRDRVHTPEFPGLALGLRDGCEQLPYSQILGHAAHWLLGTRASYPSIFNTALFRPAVWHFANSSEEEVAKWCIVLSFSSFKNIYGSGWQSLRCSLFVGVVIPSI